MFHKLKQAKRLKTQNLPQLGVGLQEKHTSYSYGTLASYTYTCPKHITSYFIRSLHQDRRALLVFPLYRWGQSQELRDLLR